MKKLLSLLLLAFSAASLRATVLVQDSTNYPYVNGPIAGQGQWYIYSSGTASNDAVVTNNTIYLKSTGYDSIATPTNGFFSSAIAATNSFTWASFTLNVSKIPSSGSDGYFCQFLSTNGNRCCNLFITSAGTNVPGTYRLAIANFSVSFTNVKPPIPFDEDLATNVNYTVVIVYDTDQNDLNTTGASLLINPSAADYNNLMDGADPGSDTGSYGYVYGDDKGSTFQNTLELSAIGFQPYVNAGISNVIVATAFSDVYNTNAIPAPVFGVQPASGTNYAGNPTTFYSLAAGSDLTYQWYSTTYGALSDGASYTGSQSNILTVNLLTATDTYYAVATDALGHTATSSNAVETVITTPTPVFFATNFVATTNTNNLFYTTTFKDTASGTGPIGYQWYFKSTNAGSSFVALSGSNANSISIFLADFHEAGQYYVVASNSFSSTNGPTNTLVEIAPLVATIAQLHGFVNTASNLAAIAANPGGTTVVNANNLVTSGWVSVYSGYGSTYSEFFIQDTNGYGVEVYLGGKGNTNTPPIGTHVTVTGELEVYHGQIEMAPSSLSGIVTDSIPPIAFYPILGNPNFVSYATNPIGSNALLHSCSLMTLTNVYLYGSPTGGALGANGAHYGQGGTFYDSGYTILWITVGGPYSATAPINTNVFEIFQPTYDYNYTNGANVTTIPNPFDNQPIPTHCAQLTGVFTPYGSSPSYVELIPTRYADYAVSSPAPFTVSYGETNGALGLSWPAIAGNTYSVYGGTNVTSAFTNEAYGIGYYPTNGAFSETISNSLSAKYFSVTSP